MSRPTKITCARKPKKYRDTQYCRDIAWKASLPFLWNPRGYLIHRVRAVDSHIIRGKWSHDTATYWCGNCGRGEFVSEPPQGYLLCAVCEAQAVAHGEPSAESIVGRHVCIGKLRAVMVCCGGEKN